jgi:transcriptional regulator with XRE-family HTH domain
VADPLPLLVGVGHAIRQLREDRRMSQQRLSEATGVHWNYIGGIERAERNPTVEVIARLAQALGVRTSELFRLAEESAPTG